MQYAVAASASFLGGGEGEEKILGGVKKCTRKKLLFFTF